MKKLNGLIEALLREAGSSRNLGKSEGVEVVVRVAMGDVRSVKAVGTDAKGRTVLVLERLEGDKRS